MRMRTIIITGAPAAGKTAFRGELAKIPEFKSWPSTSIDVTLRTMHARDELNGISHLDSDGALILSHVDDQILTEAIRRLFSQRSDHAGNAIIEVPIHSAVFEHLVNSEASPESTAVICLRAPKPVRLDRNDHRGSGRINRQAVASMPDVVAPADVDLIRLKGTAFTYTDSDRPLSEMLDSTMTWLHEL